jgi:hypothetical protein
MPDPVTTPNELLADVRTSIVYTKKRWADDWTERPFLFCDFATFTASPQVASAGFSRRYGVGMRQGEQQFDQVDALDPIGHWVKVAIDCGGDEPRNWYGRIGEDVRNVAGATFGNDDERVPHGAQGFIAYGLEALLMRQPIVDCWVLQSDRSEKRLGRAMEINAPNAVADVGNCSKQPGPRGTRIFAQSHSAEHAVAWSTRKILWYLLRYHTPLAIDGPGAQQEIEWGIDMTDASYRYLSDSDGPRVRLHGRTVKQVLDELLDRRRGLGYTVRIDPNNDKAVVIRPFTFAEQDIDLPGGEVLEANRSQKTIDFDRSIDVDLASIRKSSAQTYERAIAVGQRVRCVGTFSKLDENLDQDWTAATAQLYNAGSPAAADPDVATDFDQKMNLHRDYRAGDQFTRVYSYFRIPSDWDGQVNDGEDGRGGGDLFPYVSLGVDQKTEAVWYVPELRVEQDLPLWEGRDYSDVAVLQGGDGDNPDSAGDERLPPLVFLKQADSLHADPSTETNPDGPWPYVQVELMAAANEIPGMGDDEGRKFCCSVRPQQSAPGLVLKVMGAPQYAIASADFRPADDSDELYGDYDWQDNLMATVSLAADYHITATWPKGAPQGIDALRTLTIDARAVAGCTWIQLHTVVGLDDQGFPKRAENGAFLRDDRPILRDIARLAFEWYGTERQILTFGVKRLTDMLDVGDLITEVGADETLEPIRTVVTEARYDFAQNERDINHTTFQTQWAELDVLQLATQQTGGF